MESESSCSSTNVDTVARAFSESAAELNNVKATGGWASVAVTVQFDWRCGAYD